MRGKLNSNGLWVTMMYVYSTAWGVVRRAREQKLFWWAAMPKPWPDMVLRGYGVAFGGGALIRGSFYRVMAATFFRRGS